MTADAPSPNAPHSCVASVSCWPLLPMQQLEVRRGRPRGAGRTRPRKTGADELGLHLVGALAVAVAEVDDAGAERDAPLELDLDFGFRPRVRSAAW
ncbi:hypothetical protein [Amycolatopsis vastitatis]|nr:hypothetical protein [Amycolatopsis vastitatis]